MILTGRYNHQALVKCGAKFVRDEPDGNTYVAPDGLDISGLAVLELGLVREHKSKAAKAEAKRRIIGLFPNATLENYRDKELTALMRGARLLKKKQAATITAEENTELDALDAKAAKLEAIIAASNLIESDIVASADPANFDVIGSLRWPA